MGEGGGRGRGGVDTLFLDSIDYRVFQLDKPRLGKNQDEGGQREPFGPLNLVSGSR